MIIGMVYPSANETIYHHFAKWDTTGYTKRFDYDGVSLLESPDKRYYVLQFSYHLVPVPYTYAIALSLQCSQFSKIIKDKNTTINDAGEVVTILHTIGGEEMIWCFMRC